mgnify:CR=1 FL=1
MIDGNYEITVLGAADSANAAKWLGDHGYKVPEGGAIPADQAWLRFPPAWTRLYADGRLVA